MASRRVGYPEVMSWPSVFIGNVSPCSVCILTSLPSSLIHTTVAHFCSLLSCMRIRCWVSIMTCARSVFAAEAIQSGLNGSQHQITNSKLETNLNAYGVKNTSLVRHYSQTFPRLHFAQSRLRLKPELASNEHGQLEYLNIILSSLQKNHQPIQWAGHLRRHRCRPLSP